MKHSAVAIGENTWFSMRRESTTSSQHCGKEGKGEPKKGKKPQKKGETEKGKVDQKRILTLKRHTCEVQDAAVVQKWQDEKRVSLGYNGINTFL